MKRIFLLIALIVCMILSVACASSTDTGTVNTGAAVATNGQGRFQMKTKILLSTAVKIEMAIQVVWRNSFWGILNMIN